MLRRTSVLGSLYSEVNYPKILEALLAKRGASPAGYVCISNVHTTMMGVFDSSFRRITNSARFAVPDGQPLVWAMRSLGVTGQTRVRGPTLMRDLVDKGRSVGLKHYLYGGSPKAITELEARLRSDYRNCDIVGVESPPYQPIEAISAEGWQASAARINASGADIVWVGLGAPKQENWMWEQRDRIIPVMVGVGAAFDLISGRVPEAPMALQNLGLEWAYRLYREPRRLWRRYIFNNPLFLILWFFQFLKFKAVGSGRKLES